MRNRFLLPALLALPAMACANMYVPTFVEMLLAPTFWSAFVFTMIVTVPVLMVIALIEMLAVRRYLVEGTGRQLWTRLFWVNVATALFRLPALPDPEKVWLPFVIAYVLTVLLEAICLRIWLREKLAAATFRKALFLSARMNTASYAVLALGVAAMLYLPEIGRNAPEVRAQARGTILAFPMSALSIDVASGLLTSRRGEESGAIGKAVAEGTLTRIEDGRQIVRYRMAGNRMEEERVGALPAALCGVAASEDGRLVLCRTDGQWGVYDREAGQMRTLPVGPTGWQGTGHLSHGGRYLWVSGANNVQLTWLFDLQTGRGLNPGDQYAAFSPAEDVLAWADTDAGAIIIYDLATGERRSLPAPGVKWGRVAWSPDGSLIAYADAGNRFVRNHWYPELRAINVRTGKSAMICRRLFTCGRPCDLLWVP